MALFPVISNFQYDFVLQLVAVDTDNSMDEVAAAAAHHSVGRRVAPRPDKVIRVRRQDGEQFYPRDAKLAETDIKPMETLEFIFCDD
ncbi:toluene-4-monooxygenase system B family protein [Paraburkholderia sabiae]|uniref:Toluene 4-monooxygenase protein B n=5 Tax=Paraburkholderia TaxID=1822464 RepID=A0A1H7DX10_9BURK|nr:MULTISPECIES: toluene-4-monooxygenase system B family protein [Paraburkholderia]AFT90254.1 Toluene-4-monooxygenase system protein B [Paraburkholderia phenoliruptrix BR3459a]MBP0596313.1 toluene-4-monooxygenase system B family protein [Paraburkholderia sp. LEh10]WJZ79689.1 toluene-4-monooxygenase system B family protein [Paraburkholderia sabiae]CAB4052633.1 Toluene-4-monooxygenase system, hydroxylase component subunit gamma [Paraburkholderia phenoliruptrix]CAD6563355.1 Toluene-4-monooxygenas